MASELLPLLIASTSSDPAVRGPAEETLIQARAAPSIGLALFRLAGDGSIDAGARLLAAIELKNVARDQWAVATRPVSRKKKGGKKKQSGKARPEEASGTTAFPADDRIFLQNNIGPAVVATVGSPPLHKVLLAFLAIMVRNDFQPGSAWCRTLVQQLGDYLGSNSSPEAARAGAAILVKVLKDADHAMDAKATASLASAVLEPLLPGILAWLSGTQDPVCAKSLIKAIYHACSLGVVPDCLRSDKAFQAWFGETLTRYGARFEPESRFDLRWKPKKWVAMLWARLFNGTADMSDTVPAAQRHFAEGFQRACHGPLVSAALEFLAWHASCPPGMRDAFPPRLLSSAIDLLAVASTLASSYRPLKPHVDDLVRQALWPILRLSEEETDIFLSDPAEFCRMDFDSALDKQFDPRSAAVSFCADIFAMRDRAHLDAAMALASSCLAPGSAPHDVDAALLLVGGCSMVLANEPDYHPAMAQLVRDAIAPAIADPNTVPFVRSRALWTFARLVHAVDLPIDLVGPTAGAAAGIIVDKEAPLVVRSSAARALGSLADLEGLQAATEEWLGSLVPAYFELVDALQHDELVLALKDLMRVHGEALLPHATALVEQLVARFVHFVAVAEEAGADTTGEEDGVVLAAYQCLGAIRTIFVTLGDREETDDPTMLGLLRDTWTAIGRAIVPLLPAVRSDLWVEDVAKLFSFFSYFCPSPLPADAWVFFDATLSSPDAHSEEHSADIVPVLDNFLARGAPADFGPDRQAAFLALADRLTSTGALPDDADDDEKLPIDEVQTRLHGFSLLEAALLQQREASRGSIVDFAVRRGLETLASAEAARSSVLRLVGLNCLHGAGYAAPRQTLARLSDAGALEATVGASLAAVRDRTLPRSHDRRLALAALAAFLTCQPLASSPLASVSADFVRAMLALVAQQDEAAAGEEESEEDDGGAAGGGAGGGPSPFVDIDDWEDQDGLAGLSARRLGDDEDFGVPGMGFPGIDEEELMSRAMEQGLVHGGDDSDIFGDPDADPASFAAWQAAEAGAEEYLLDDDDDFETPLDSYHDSIIVALALDRYAHADPSGWHTLSASLPAGTTAALDDLRAEASEIAASLDEAGHTVPPLPSFDA